MTMIARSETVADHLNWLLIHGVGRLNDLTAGADVTQLRTITQDIEARLRALDDRLQEEANALGRIYELLHPNDDPDYEWPVELIEEVAAEVYTVFPAPTKDTVEGLLQKLEEQAEFLQDEFCDDHDRKAAATRQLQLLGQIADLLDTPPTDISPSTTVLEDVRYKVIGHVLEAADGCCLDDDHDRARLLDMLLRALHELDEETT